MERKELDDMLYGAMMEALGNCGLPVPARAKARIADELTSEAVRLVMVQIKAEGAKPEVKAKRTRKSRAKKGNTEAPPNADPTVPAPFGAHR